MSQLPISIHKLLSNLVHNLNKSLPIINQRCEPYQKGVRTQDKGINKNFQNIVQQTTQNTLNEAGYYYEPSIGDVLSDVSLETDTFILQVDAKGCHVDDGDFTIKKDNCFHGHCGIAQTSLVSNALFTSRKSGESIQQKGLQRQYIDEKPVYTFIAYMRWGYTSQYYFDSCGVIYLPHTSEDIYFRVGKSKDEMRWVLKNPSLYCLHQFSSEQLPQIQG